MTLCDLFSWEQRGARRHRVMGAAGVAMTVLGGAAWACAQVAPAPRESAPREHIVISKPNGERIERDIERGSLGALGRGSVSAARQRAEGAANRGASESSGVAPPGFGAREVRAGGRVAARISKRSGGEARVEPAGASEAASDALVAGWVPNRDGGGRYAEFQPTRIPERPARLRAADNGHGAAVLSWVIASSNQSAFMVEREPPFSNGQARYPAPGATFWVDECGPGRFVYTLRAINEDAMSAATDPVEVMVGDNQVVMPAIMRPGATGWPAGEPAQPPAQGSPSERGYDAKAIARFDMIPNQEVVGYLDVGVVAFHMNGIERVEFAVEGGTPVNVTAMQLNAQTGVWEYFARVMQSDFEGGRSIEVRATAYPTTGVPRVLEPLRLYVPTANWQPITMYVSPTGSDVTGDGSDANPYKSINKAAKQIEARQNGVADGGVINLKAGDHLWGPAGRDADGGWISYPTTEQRFLTIQTDPRIRKRDVRIVDSPGGGLRTKLVHLRNVTVVGCQLENAQPTNSDRAEIWVHGCTFMGPSLVQMVRWIAPEAYPGGAYVTNTVVRDAVEGWSGTTLVRGCTIDGIGNDALVNCLMVVNCEVRNIVNPEGTGFHSDVLQYHTQETPFENIIVYNLRAVNNTAQAWNVGYTRRGTGPAWSDVALVNVMNEQDAAGYSSSWAADVNHLLWWNLTIPVGFVFIIDHPGEQEGQVYQTRLHNFSMKGCVLRKFNNTVTSGEPSQSDPAWATDNHFIDVTSYGTMTAGTQFTTGGTMEQLFADPGGKDFSARPGSPLCNRGTAVVVDSVGRGTGQFRAIGALQPLEP
ncbi:MAG: hypothetical protein AB7G11_17000 [Phycisphaerales bacterium]